MTLQAGRGGGNKRNPLGFPRRKILKAYGKLGVVIVAILAVVFGSLAALRPVHADNPDYDDPCWNAGLDSESWFVCPTLNNLQYTAGPLESMVQSWLTVEPELYNFDSPTYTVWEIMRNIANGFMIVFLLAIIFSQLTGWGIDNYGIKKMLPRLITMAILINLSFIICEVAVDLSNILGVGLRDMFGGIGNKLLEGKDVAAYMEDFLGTIIAAIFAAVGVAGAAAPAGLVIAEAGIGGGGPMVAVIIILALIVVVAAILLFFVALGARMIIIIVCVAIAPVAFSLYVLPNTQNLFKKWWDIFKAALVIFPICGALGGVSVLIKAMVLTTDGIHLWMLVVAILAPFLPFFLLPMLLKNSVAMLGKVGGALQTMGEKFRGGARGLSDTAQRSNRYQDMMQFGKDQTAVRRAQRIKHGRSLFGGRIQTKGLAGRDPSELSRRQQDKLEKANAALLAGEERDQKMVQNIDPEQFEASRARQGFEIDQAGQDNLLYRDAGFVTAQATKRQNTRADQMAEAEVGVFELNGDLARQRAQSRRDAQEYKAYQDQFAGYSRDQLSAEAAGASTWLSEPGGSQRMSALIGAMQQNGMQKDVYSMLKQNNVSQMSGVMQTLAASDDKILKAYGKRGEGQSYEDFMQGGGLQQYAAEKGADFINGLDDKALAEIAANDAESVAKGNGNIMSTEQLLQAATKLSDEESMAQVNSMLRDRSDIVMSGEQLSRLNDSTVVSLLTTDSGKTALLKASDDMAKSGGLLSAKMNANSKTRVNVLRGMRTDGGNKTAL